jgi:hypothetical protein
MKIVIDIDKNYYEMIKHDVNNGMDYLPCVLIAKGTPLPKGHGRLIDADKFEKRLMDARSYYIGEKADDFDLRFAAGLKSAAERLVDAPTIIEADKAESEE